MWDYFRLTIWANIWLAGWIVTLPFRKGRDNCLTWALRQQREKGGYLIVRWARTDKVSDHFKHPHFGWLPEDFHVCTQHYVPDENNPNESLIPHPWFEGTVKQGDGNELIQKIIRELSD